MTAFGWRIIREAAWPGLLVLVAHSILGAIFGHEPYVDPAMHLCGGAAAAFFFVRMPRLLPGHFGELTPTARCLLAFGLASAVAVFWELGEYVSDVYLGTHAHQTIAGTLRDLADGMTGAAALVAGDLVLHRHAVRKEQACDVSSPSSASSSSR